MYKTILLALMLTGCTTSGREADADESGFPQTASNSTAKNAWRI